jgi:molybdopterin/thiamine biosynthesis adenylyltransferase
MAGSIEIDPIFTASHNSTASLRTIVVGAGGTGGRLIPPLMQVLRRGDSVAIVDGDHVEDRNLARQNFRPRDVGLNKAEVMAQRYRREGIEVDAYAAMLTRDNWREIVAGTGRARSTGVVILGCVDNAAARALMEAIYTAPSSCLWIDGGNEMRGGQVVVSTSVWPMKVSAPHPRDAEKMREINGNWSLDGMTAMPQLLKTRPEDAAQASCQDRIDLQTVAVNQLSATCMLNVLACFLYKVPMSSCGAFFSTLNTMCPIRVKRVNWDEYALMPETTYAA